MKIISNFYFTYSFILVFFLFNTLAQAQTRDEFVEKLEALDIDDNKSQLALLDKAIKAFPKDADFYLRRADLKSMMEKPFSYQDTYGFIADYTKAIEFDNVSWRYVSRSRGKVNIKDYKGALADCNIAISMAEKKGEREHIFSAYHQRADIFVFLQDYKSAIADLEKALKNTEQNGFAGAMLSSMADYAKELKDYDASMKYIERAITVYQKINDATEGTMYYNRGLLKIEHLNKKEEGCADFKKAISFYKPEETGMIDMVKDAIKAHCN